MADNNRSPKETIELLDQLISAYNSMHELWDNFEAKLLQNEDEDKAKKAA